jgi:hypothetical protein
VASLSRSGRLVGKIPARQTARIAALLLDQ